MNEEKLSQTLSSDSVLALRDALYYIALYDENKEFDPKYAYLDGDYFYIYRGKKSRYDMTKPGIYKDADTGKIVKIDPITDEEKEYYSSEGKIVSYDPKKAAELINQCDDLFIPVSDSCKVFNPEITVDDDILKRVLKMLFVEKEIDLDSCKDRFPDKNALFNFKQNMKNPKARVTMKIFERVCDVVGVEYVIVLKEKENSIGKKLTEDIVASSEDTYDYTSIKAEEDDDDEE